MTTKDWTPQLSTPWSLLIFLALANKDKGLRNPRDTPTVWSLSHIWVDKFKKRRRIMAVSEVLGHCRFLESKGLISFRAPQIELTTPNPFSVTFTGLEWSRLLWEVPMVQSWVNMDRDVLTNKKKKSSVELYWKEALVLAALQFRKTALTTLTASKAVDISLWLSPGQLDHAIRSLTKGSFDGRKGTPSEGFSDFQSLTQDIRENLKDIQGGVKVPTPPAQEVALTTEVAIQTTKVDVPVAYPSGVAAVPPSTHEVVGSQMPVNHEVVGSQMPVPRVTFPKTLFRPVSVEISDSDLENLQNEVDEDPPRTEKTFDEEAALDQAILELGCDGDEDLVPPDLRLTISLSKADFELIQEVSMRNSVTPEHLVTELLEPTLKALRGKQVELQKIEEDLRQVEEARSALLEKRASLLQ